MRKVAVVSALAAVGAIAACVASSFSEGQFACTPGSAAECPPGLVCARDGRCRLNELVADATIDTGSNDASVEGDGAVDCPTARFSTTFEGRSPRAITVTPEQRVFVAGVQGTQAWLAEVDRCDGHILQERTVSGGSSFEALTQSGEELVAVGNAPVSGGEGTGVGRFRRDLGTIVFTPVGGYGGGADHVMVTSTNAIWVAGNKPTIGFIAHTERCAVDLPASPGGIVPNGTGALAIIRGNTVASLETVDLDCKRSDAGAGTIKAGTSSVQPRALILTDDGMAALGTAAGTSPNTLVWIATSKGGSFTRVEVDPNPFDPDDARGLAYDGQALFAAVSQRAIGGGVGTPTIFRFPTTIVATTTREWSAAPFGATLLDIRGIATTRGKDGIFVVATSATGGGIARCTKTGECK